MFDLKMRECDVGLESFLYVWTMSDVQSEELLRLTQSDSAHAVAECVGAQSFSLPRVLVRFSM